MAYVPRFAISPRLLSLVEVIASLRERILGVAVELSRIPALQKNTRTRNGHASTTIEGNPLTLEQVRAVGPRSTSQDSAKTHADQKGGLYFQYSNYLWRYSDPAPLRKSNRRAASLAKQRSRDSYPAEKRLMLRLPGEGVTDLKSQTTAQPDSRNYDALIIGAGVSGLYQLYKLRQLGMRVRVIERGHDVGGTWYWNRYPGARFDSESYTYGYSFSPELLADWKWSEHFAAQPETLRYLQHVADRFDLRRDIEFGREVVAAHFQRSAQSWEIALADGGVLRARFLISAMGPFAAPTLPNIPGVADFAGEAYHTSAWPHTPVSFAGKRVGVIGTGATGVQLIPLVAKSAAQLTVFQRNPNWCAPLGNSAIDDATQSRIAASYDEIMERCRQSYTGFMHVSDRRNALDVSAAERHAVYEKLYDAPGFGLWMGNFRDVLVDERANATLSEFVANKIRARVTDPVLAEKLIPRNHGFGTRRVPLETGYYETYNEPHVRLVDLNETPIERITADGIRTSTEQHDLDFIVFATGFNAVLGGFERVEIRGGDGRTLQQAWADGPHTMLGLTVPGFPNLFTLVGPHNAATFCNMPRCIEQNVEWVSDLLRHMRERELITVEATDAAATAWTTHVHESASRMLFTKVDSWFTGVNSNLTGRQQRHFLLYAAGFPVYIRKCAEVAASGYEGFTFG